MDRLTHVHSLLLLLRLLLLFVELLVYHGVFQLSRPLPQGDPLVGEVVEQEVHRQRRETKNQADAPLLATSPHVTAALSSHLPALQRRTTEAEVDGGSLNQDDLNADGSDHDGEKHVVVEHACTSNHLLLFRRSSSCTSPSSLSLPPTFENVELIVDLAAVDLVEDLAPVSGTTRPARAHLEQHKGVEHHGHVLGLGAAASLLLDAVAAGPQRDEPGEEGSARAVEVDRQRVGQCLTREGGREGGGKERGGKGKGGGGRWLRKGGRKELEPVVADAETRDAVVDRGVDRRKPLVVKRWRSSAAHVEEKVQVGSSRALIHVRSHLTDVADSKDEREQNQQLPDCMSEHVLDHDLGEDGSCAMIGIAVEELVLEPWRLVGILSSEGERSEGVHDEVDPQQLDDCDRALRQNCRSHRREDAGDDVDGELELEELADVVIDAAAPLHRRHDGLEVVVEDHNVCCLLRHLRPVDEHREPDVRLLQRRRVVGPIPRHCDDLPRLLVAVARVDDKSAALDARDQDELVCRS
eukprot:768698-Hanusia_phi.AAC.5